MLLSIFGRQLVVSRRILFRKSYLKQTRLIVTNECQFSTSRDIIQNGNLKNSNCLAASDCSRRPYRM